MNQQHSARPILAGAGRIDITPAMGIQIAGDIGRYRPVEEIRDPLYANALVLQVNEKNMVANNQPFTRTTLAADLRRLGVAAGDLLFVHSSFKSLGPVAGGAAAVVGALEDALGPEGTLLMPSFNLLAKDRKGTWNIARAPSTTGWLTEYFRQMPGTYRSDHFSHSVAARGKGAAEFVEGHLRREGWKCDQDVNSEPWGYAYGFDSPMFKAYERGGKMLFIGTGYQTATYLHLVEARHATEYLKKDPAVEYNMIYRPAAGAYWESLGRVRHAKIGNADCRLCGIRDFVDTMYAAICARPHRFLNVWEPKPRGVRRVTVAGHTIVYESTTEEIRRPHIFCEAAGALTVTFGCGRNIVARRSADGGETWQALEKVPTNALAAASDKAVLSDGQIMMVYKTGQDESADLAVRIVENDRSEFNQVLEFNVTEGLNFSAASDPCAVEYSPGRVLLVYAAKTGEGKHVIGATRLKLF